MSRKRRKSWKNRKTRKSRKRKKSRKSGKSTKSRKRRKGRKSRTKWKSRKVRSKKSRSRRIGRRGARGELEGRRRIRVFGPDSRPAPHRDRVPTLLSCSNLGAEARVEAASHEVFASRSKTAPVDSVFVRT